MSTLNNHRCVSAAYMTYVDGSNYVSAFSIKVCLPGGMVSEGGDRSIVQTCLREMEEEIGIGHDATTVLGVLRCNWGEVCVFILHSLRYVLFEPSKLNNCSETGPSFGRSGCHTSSVFPWRNRRIAIIVSESQ